MKEIWVWIQAVLAAVGGFSAGCIRQGGTAFSACWRLSAFSTIPDGRAVCAIPSDKKLSSEIGFKGISRKVLIFRAGGLGQHHHDSQVLGDGGAVRTAVIFSTCPTRV